MDRPGENPPGRLFWALEEVFHVPPKETGGLSVDGHAFTWHMCAVLPAT
jgi:hypothetical protein